MYCWRYVARLAEAAVLLSVLVPPARGLAQALQGTRNVLAIVDKESDEPRGSAFRDAGGGVGELGVTGLDLVFKP